MITSTALHAKKEFEILNRTVKDAIIAPFEAEILALCEKFGKSGQSGGSAPMTASAISQAVKSLLLQEPICDITGIDEEWIDVADMNNGETLYQNNRCSAIFKHNDGNCHYVDAIIFKTQKGFTYNSGSVIMPDGSIIGSKQKIKSFPFKPKTFYIDVIETEVAKDDWEFRIKDESQLIPVFKCYDRLLK